METETFHDDMEAKALKRAEERNIPKERIVLLKVTKTVESRVSYGEAPTLAVAVKNAYIPGAAFDISQPVIKEKGGWPFKKWRIEIAYKMPAEVILRYRI